MKALSIKQPFAELILQGRKTIELRKWNTKFRGNFLIHSPKYPDKKAMKFFRFADLPVGCVVGKADLTDVKNYKDKIEHAKDKNKHLASSDWGNYGFVLNNAERFSKPISCRGFLNFWNFDR